MPRYVRAVVPGGTFFFTVVTLERSRGLLTKNIDVLREVFARAQRRRPFTIDAIVVLPDHLHCIWTLPTGDSDFSSRWHEIKACFSAPCRNVRRYQRGGAGRVNEVSGSGGSGSI